MSVWHVQQIKAHLTAEYASHIDISDYLTKPEDQKTNALLSRSLAAFSISHLTGLTPPESAAKVTDGGQDNGIDAIHYDKNEKILYLVQSKWKNDGSGSVERGDVQKFITGVNDLLNARFERFNDKVRNRKAEVDAAIMDAQSGIVLVVTYTGQDPLASEPARDLEDCLNKTNDAGEIASLQVLRLENIHKIIAQGAAGAPINLEVVLHEWGQTLEPYRSFYGQVTGSDVASWWDLYSTRLFAPNLRMFLGATEVNESLADTVRTHPDRFWYFNNGITAICTSIKKKPIGANTRETGIFECSGVTIVNGAQTVGSVAKASLSHKDQVSRARIPIRFISLEHCPEGFAAEVTRATNTQNRIEKRDFVSLDGEQERIKGELQLDGIAYVYKSGETMPVGQRGCDLTEAAVALACFHSDLSLAIQAKREISKLWDDITKAPYKIIFNPSVSGRRVWRIVQISRAIDSILKVKYDEMEGRDRMFAVHGNRFIAHEVFKRLPKGEIENADIETLKGKANTLTENLLDAIIAKTNVLFPDSYLAMLFKNQNKCRALDLELKQQEENGTSTL